MIWIILSIVLTIGLIALGVVNKTAQAQVKRRAQAQAEQQYANAKRRTDDAGELAKLKASLDQQVREAVSGASAIPLPGMVTGVGWLAVVAFLCLGLFNKAFFYADPAYIYHIKTLAGQESSVAGATGYTWYGFGEYKPWKQAMTVLAGAEGGVDTSVSMPPDDIMFLDQVDANAFAMARFQLPTDEDSFLKVVHNYRTPSNLLRSSLIPAFQETLQATASLMTAEEYFSGGRTEFINEFSNQMKNGAYVVKRTETTVKSTKTQKSEADASSPAEQDVFGDGSKTVFKVEKVLENDGVTPKRSPQEFLNYGVQVVETRVTQVKPTSTKFLEQIQLKIKASADRAVAREQKIQEEEQRLLAVARGDRQVAEKQAQMKVEQMTITTTAETKKKQAIIAANLKKEQALIDEETAKINLNIAKINADALVVAKEAEAHGKKVILEADNALEIKVEAWKYGINRMAEAYAKRDVPAYMNISGGETGSANPDSQTQQFMLTMNTLLAKQLDVDLSVKKDANNAKQ